MSGSEPSIDDAATELSDEEKEVVKDRVPPRVGVVHETIRLEGEHELHRPAGALFWSGLAAGMSMGFSLVATGVLQAVLPDRPWREAIAQLGYTVGFLVVIVGRQQLFTENTITPVIPLLHNRDAQTLWKLLRLWSIVLAANLIGVLAFSWVCARTGTFRPEMKEAFRALGLAALEGGAWVHFLRAIFAGWLVALMVWLLANAEGSRIAVIVVTTYLIGIARLSHVVAGSIDVSYVVWCGAAGWHEAITRFFLPTLAGNVLGGGALVAAIGHAQTVADEK